jgi:hypothetical protein
MSKHYDKTRSVRGLIQLDVKFMAKSDKFSHYLCSYFCFIPGSKGMFLRSHNTRLKNI